MRTVILVSDEMLAELRKLAEEECLYDYVGYSIDDYAGGNVDDAFYNGERAGRIMLARKIISDINKSALKVLTNSNQVV